MAKPIYNDLSEEFKKEIGWGIPLKAEEKVEFQHLDIHMVKQNGEMLPFYSTKWIPNTCSIYDPYAKKFVTIAYVVNEALNTEDDPKKGLGDVEFKKEDKCVITITGKELNKMPLLWYLRAHSLNQSNHRASKTEYGFKFKELEPQKTAKQKLKEREELANCVSYILGKSEAEVIAFLQALKLPVLPSADENKSMLVEYVQVKSQRDKFNYLSQDVRTPIAALIEKAIALEEIAYDKDPKIWIYFDTKMTITQVPHGTDPKAHLIEFFHNNAHGKSIKDFLEAKIGKRNAEELVEETKAEVEKTNKHKK